MKIVVPYANNVSDPGIFEAVQRNLALTGLPVDYRRMTEPNSYSLLLNELFEVGEKFVIVEHDVIVTKQAIEEVWNCPAPFCGWDGLICCAKVDPAVCAPCPVDPHTGWWIMDAELHRGLFARGIGFHDHVFVSGYVVSNLNRHNVPRQD